MRGVIYILATENLLKKFFRAKLLLYRGDGGGCSCTHLNHPPLSTSSAACTTSLSVGVGLSGNDPMLLLNMLAAARRLFHNIVSHVNQASIRRVCPPPLALLANPPSPPEPSSMASSAAPASPFRELDQASFLQRAYTASQHPPAPS